MQSEFLSGEYPAGHFKFFKNVLFSDLEIKFHINEIQTTKLIIESLNLNIQGTNNKVLNLAKLEMTRMETETAPFQIGFKV